MEPHRYTAIVLLGPTGTGKSPLGDLLEQNRIGGLRCVHFDFGARLRGTEDGSIDAGLDEHQHGVVRAVLRGNALLEDDHFPIARAVFDAFVRERQVSPGDIVICNGLPRHIGQARAVEPFLDIVAGIVLYATPAVVHERICKNTGGDRGARKDDSLEEIERKLEIYSSRTEKLIDFYRKRESSIVMVEVSGDMGPAEMVAGVAPGLSGVLTR